MIELTKSQLLALVSADFISRYAMNAVHVMEKGITETTDGHLLVRVAPSAAPRDPQKAVLIDAKAALKAGRDLPKRKKGRRGDVTKSGVARVYPERKTLEYTDKSGNEVVLKDVVVEGKFPPTKDIIDSYKTKKVTATTSLRVGMLKKLVRALDNAGCDTIRVDFCTRQSGLRIAGVGAEGEKICGVIMPLTVVSEDTIDMRFAEI